MGNFQMFQRFCGITYTSCTQLNIRKSRENRKTRQLNPNVPCEWLFIVSYICWCECVSAWQNANLYIGLNAYTLLFHHSALSFLCSNVGLCRVSTKIIHGNNLPCQKMVTTSTRNSQTNDITINTDTHSQFIFSIEIDCVNIPSGVGLCGTLCALYA